MRPVASSHSGFLWFLGFTGYIVLLTRDRLRLAFHLLPRRGRGSRLREASVTRHAPLAFFLPRFSPRFRGFIAHSPRICFSTSSFFRRFGGEPSLSSTSRFLIPSCGSSRSICASLELVAFPFIRHFLFFRRFPACKPAALPYSFSAYPTFCSFLIFPLPAAARRRRCARRRPPRPVSFPLFFGNGPHCSGCTPAARGGRPPNSVCA